jgi:hypothetical protein
VNEDEEVIAVTDRLTALVREGKAGESRKTCELCDLIARGRYAATHMPASTPTILRRLSDELEKLHSSPRRRLPQ